MNHVTIVEILIAIFACNGFWAVLQTWITNRSKSRSAEQKLLLGLAYKVILEMCHTHIEKGEIDADDYKELNHYLFEPYKDLGGNGTAAKLVKEVEGLPIKKEVN